MEIFILRGIVGDNDHVLAAAFGNGRQRRLIGRLFLLRRSDRWCDKQAVFTGEHQLVEKVPGFLLALLGEQVVHVGRQTPYYLHPQVKAVLLHIAVSGHVIEVLGGSDLGGKFSGEIYAVSLDEFHEPVELVRGNKGVDRIAEQQKICLLQF